MSCFTSNNVSVSQTNVSLTRALHWKTFSHRPRVKSCLVTVGMSSHLPLCSVCSTYNDCALETSWSEAGRPLGRVFCCVVVNYGLACVTLPAATFTFHPQLTLQNIDYIHTPLLALFRPCQAADCCASLNQGLLSPKCVFIVDYSCVFWPASGCVAQLLVTGTDTKCIQSI